VCGLTEAQVSTAKARRRTQAERRAATRAAVTTAALETLSERGYALMTLADVASAAGVSRGALLHYFPQKADLALGAIEEGEAIVLRRLRGLVAGIRDRPERDELMLDALYEIFSGVEFQAFLAVQVHARTDPALNARLREIVARATEQMGSIAADVWGVCGAAGLWETTAVILGTVRGLVLVADVSAPSNAKVWPKARLLLITAVHELRSGAPAADTC
jgi:AcrR family transcriptional regulator